MSIELIFNELSLVPVAASRDTARKHVQLFLETVRAASNKGISRQLRTKENFKEAMLADGYSWRDWSNDPAVLREARLYFKGLVTRAPLLDGLDHAQNKEPGFEFYFNNQISEGLGAAFLTDNLAVSLASKGEWDFHAVSIIVNELLEDGNIQEQKRCVRHASRPDHVETNHRSWIRERLKRSVENGADLWEKSRIYFPSLSFCAVVQRQMGHLPKEALTPILRGLFCLETYCQSWKSGGFNLDSLGCASSTESKTTREQFGQERTFSCPDGIERMFSYHVKPGQPWRVYFDPSPGPGRMFVGYVGRHLPTVRFSH